MPNSGFEQITLKSGVSYWFRPSDRSIQPDPPHLHNLGLDSKQAADKKAVKEAWWNKCKAGEVTDEVREAYDVLRRTGSRAQHLHRNTGTVESHKFKGAMIALSMVD